MDQKISHTSLDFRVLSTSDLRNTMILRVARNRHFRVLKVLRPERRGDPRCEALLRKEFEIGYGLEHPNICRVYSFGEDERFGNYIEMEWVDGVSLKEMISSGTIDNRLCRKLICELCDALDYLHHAQIVHRDLKPENILVTHNGQNVKLIDFGLSDEDSCFEYQIPGGTVSYASPEQLAGLPVDSRSDIYSLGLIICEMSGRRYSRISTRCLKRDPARRFASVRDVRTAVARRPYILVITLIGIIIVLSVTTAIVFSSRAGMNDRVFEEATREILKIL